MAGRLPFAKGGSAMSRRMLLVLAALLALGPAWGTAKAGGLVVGVGIGVPYYPRPYYYHHPYYYPGYRIYVAPPPVYIGPPPAYVVPAQPVYVQPAPTVYQVPAAQYQAPPA